MKREMRIVVDEEMSEHLMNLLNTNVNVCRKMGNRDYAEEVNNLMKQVISEHTRLFETTQ
jgi:hypothetical protein